MDVRQELIAFIESEQEKLYRVAFAHVKDRDDALDIVHNAIVKALQKHRTLQNPEYLRTWFFRILINECASLFRRKAKRTALQDRWLEELSDESTAPDQATYIDLYEAIEDLPIKLKTVVILRYFEDMKFGEIAAITSTNVNTVKSRLYKALRVLKMDLGVLKMMDKSRYNHTEIPETLSSVVQDAITQGTQNRRPARRHLIFRPIACTAAAFAACAIVLLNISSVFAQAASSVPVIGALCRVFTFREYHFEDNIKYVDAKIPKIDNTGNSELETRINCEIQKTINDRLTECENRAKEYYEAFVETGGDPDDFIPLGITIDYEIKHISPQYTSFVIRQHETRFRVYSVAYYYNVDMESGRILTLRDCLGNEYRKLVTQSIEDTIAGWDDEKKAMLWEDLSIPDLIDENRDFYINEGGSITVVIDKYEAASGAAGTLEFVIQAPRG